MVLVDDGSIDGTFELLREIAAVDSRVTVVKLRRNFGQTAGLAAGFDHARGEYIIAMDGDLQHDPADIPLFLEKIAEGYDIVSGWRKNRVDNFWLRRIPLALRQLADGQVERRRYPRLRHHLQSLSPRHPHPGSALRRVAPLYSRACLLAWCVHHRSSDQEREPRAWRLALRNLAHLPRLLRSVDHPLPAEISVAPAALLRHHRNVQHHGRIRRGHLPRSSKSSCIRPMS